MNPQHVLVTGAAGAIGRALARELRARWPAVKLALVDREVADLESIGREVNASSVHGLDLARIDALEAFVAEVGATIPLDGLVNCAGVMWVGALPTMAWSRAETLFAIDLLAPLRLQSLVVASLAARRSPGFVINIASMAGKIPLRGCAYYGAAKAGLAMASEIARAELAPLGIQVLTVYPGPIRSPLEEAGRTALGGSWFGGAMRTGEPGDLGRAILAALVVNQPRLIYPVAQRLGFLAPLLSSWVALRFGPRP